MDYIDIDDEIWQRNIAERNAKVKAENGGSDFYVDEELLNKVNTIFEVPEQSEIDLWIMRNS